MTVLVVDAANVVGARPDGWWRDRAGATERLLGRLAVALPELAAPDGSRVTDVVAVVEGRARDVRGPEGVRVVRAEGSGDDAVVACAAELGRDGDAGAGRDGRSWSAGAAAGRHRGDRCRLAARAAGRGGRKIGHHMTVSRLRRCPDG